MAKLTMANIADNIQNALDRAIGFISPKWGLERQYYRAVAHANRKYVGAGNGPLTADWRATGSSAMAEISQDIATLRNRTRELVRNDGWAKVAVRTLANNIVGKGIRPYITGDSERARAKVEKAFTQWCGSDVDNLGGNFYAVQYLAAITLAQSGEILLIRRYIKNEEGKWQLKLLVLEGDYINENYNVNGPTDDAKNAAYCTKGIYYNANGQVIGYRVYANHPGDTTFWQLRNIDSFFIPISEAKLIYYRARPGQVRGIPEGHSVMLEHKQLWQYELAQATKQTISASFAVFVTSASQALIGADKLTGTSRNEHLGITEEDVTPGSIYHLAPGEKIENSQPPSVDGYDEYTKNRLRKIARGWGLSYEALSGDLSRVNFSSGRMGWLEMQRNIENWQDYVLIPQLCKAVWEWWLEFAILTGEIPETANNLEVGWTPPRREMIDPNKETNAIIAQLQGGLITLPEALRQLGRNPAEIFKEIADTNTKLDQMGLVFSGDYRYHATTKFGEETGTGNKAEKEPATK